MSTIRESGTAQILVVTGEYCGEDFIHIKTKLMEPFQILLTSRIIVDHSDNANAARLIFPVFSNVVLNFVDPGFYILACEIDRRPVSADLQVTVDWAVLEP